MWGRVTSCLLGVLAASSVAQAKASPKAVLISVDGLKPASYLRADELGMKVPTLRRFMREGSYATRTKSIFPTLTFPAHVSMITGKSPARHGIENNELFEPGGDREGEWFWFAESIKAKTLFDAVKANGGTTAAIFWPVTIGARTIDENIPDFWPESALQADLYLASLTGTRVRAAFGSIDSLKAIDDEARVRLAESILADAPTLLALHLLSVDASAHVNGYDTAETKKAIEQADAHIGRVLAAIDRSKQSKQTTVVITSDHGFNPVTKIVRPSVLLKEKGLLRVDAKGHLESWDAITWAAGGSCAIVLNPKSADKAKAVDAVVRALASSETYGVAKVVSGAEARALGGFSTAHAVLIAKPGFYFKDGHEAPAVVAARIKAHHGFHPDDPEMQASFLIRGPGVRSGLAVDEIRLVDVAPTLAHALSMRLEGTDGRVVRKVFR